MGTVNRSSKRVWSDMDPDFTATRSGDAAMYVDVNSIKASIKNILNTPRGEELMNKKFGVGLYKFVFDPLDDITIDFLKESIKNDILNFETRVNVDKVDVEQTSETSILISVTFTIKDTKLEDSVTFEVTL